MSNPKIVSDWFSGEVSLNDLGNPFRRGLMFWEEEVVAKYFPHQSHVLDIGCGSGREAFYLYDKGFKITGIDVSEQPIKIAKQSAIKTRRDIDFLLTNGADIPFQSNTFDTVIMWSQAFGNVYGEENQVHLLKECHQVLKTGGVICFSGHDKSFIQNQHPEYTCGKKFYPYADTECYWEIFTIEEMISLAKKSGFQLLECQNASKWHIGEIEPGRDPGAVNYYVGRK